MVEFDNLEIFVFLIWIVIIIYIKNIYLLKDFCKSYGRSYEL